MDSKKATRLAIECIRKEIQRLAVDANLQEMYQVDLPNTIAASKKRALLREAIQTLQAGPADKPAKSKARTKKVGATQPEFFTENNLT